MSLHPAGMFYCIIHMTDMPTEKQSIDKRYCQQCYETLAKEADDMKATGNRRKAWWTPCNLATGNKRRAVVLGQVTQIKGLSVTPQNCIFCGKELTQRRKTKKFCNAACRVGANRQQTVQNDTSAKSRILKMRTLLKPNTQNEGLAERSFVNSEVNDKNQQLVQKFAQGDMSKAQDKMSKAL